MHVTSDLWHVGELPGDDGRIVRDGSGLRICTCASRADAAQIARLPELMNRAAALAQVSTWDDEFTDQEEHDAAWNPLKDLLTELSATPKEQPANAG